MNSNADWPSPNSGTRPSMVQLTPLVDVVFILLFFLMLASSYSEHRDLPVSATHEGSGSGANTPTVLLTVTPTSLLFGSQPMSPAEITARLRELASTQADLTVLVRVRDGADWQRTVTVLDTLNADAGYQVLLVAQQPWPHAP